MPRFRLEQGRKFVDEGNHRLACLGWNEGLDVARATAAEAELIPLLKAVTNVGTPRAASGLMQADTCAELEALFDFAVEGDGLRQQIEAALAARNCAR